MSKKRVREEKRAEAFYEAVSPFFSDHFKGPYELVEVCAGNGNGGRIFSERGAASKLHFVDLIQVRGLERTLSDLGHTPEICLSGIKDYVLPKVERLAVIAIHACGVLTDQVLERAAEARKAVAIMPCCYPKEMKHYDLKAPPDHRLLLYPRREDYYDAVRKQFLVEQKFQAILTQIDRRITPMNNVLIGLPS